MNNEFIVGKYNEPDKTQLPKAPFLEKRIGEIKKILEGLYGLKASGPYRNLLEVMLLPRLESLTRQMRREKEPIQLYRFQGKINELENFVDLDQWIQIYENEFKSLKGQIKTQNNAEEEIR